jgi:hypothetical protein
MARRIENTPRKTLMHEFYKGTKYAKRFSSQQEQPQEPQVDNNKIPENRNQVNAEKTTRKKKKAQKRKRKPEVVVEDQQEPQAVVEVQQEERVVANKYPNEDTPIPPELELIPDSGLPNDNVIHLYNEYYKIPNYHKNMAQKIY